VHEGSYVEVKSAYGDVQRSYRDVYDAVQGSSTASPSQPLPLDREKPYLSALQEFAIHRERGRQIPEPNRWECSLSEVPSLFTGAVTTVGIPRIGFTRGLNPSISYLLWLGTQ
jgi:hypothetical protein